MGGELVSVLCPVRALNSYPPPTHTHTPTHYTHTHTLHTHPHIAYAHTHCTCTCIHPHTANRLPVPLSSIYVFNEEEEQPNGRYSCILKNYFERSFVTGTILTRGLPTSRIMAFDAENNPIEYIIPVNSINSQLFGINATSGELYFQRALDREVKERSPFYNSYNIRNHYNYHYNEDSTLLEQA